MNEKYRKSVKTAIVIGYDEFIRILAERGAEVEYTFEGFEYTDNNGDIISEEDVIEFFSNYFDTTVLKIFTDSESSQHWDVWIQFIE